VARRKGKAPVSLDLLSREEEDYILNLATARGDRSSAEFSTLEDLLTSPEGFGITTATPLQRAICRIIEGHPLAELQQHPDVVEALGGLTNYDPSQTPPTEVVIVAGVRGGKSMIAAGTAIRAALSCDLTGLAAGEIPRFSIVSLSIDNAKVVYGHLLGALKQPRLKPLRIDTDAATA
jgi:hypothetical protein